MANSPNLDEIKLAVRQLSSLAKFIDVSDQALKLGNSVLGNIITLGALADLDILPLYRDDFEKAILDFIPRHKLEVNIKAYDTFSKLVHWQEIH